MPVLKGYPCVTRFMRVCSHGTYRHLLIVVSLVSRSLDQKTLGNHSGHSNVESLVAYPVVRTQACHLAVEMGVDQLVIQLRLGPSWLVGKEAYRS